MIVGKAKSQRFVVGARNMIEAEGMSHESENSRVINRKDIAQQSRNQSDRKRAMM